MASGNCIFVFLGQLTVVALATSVDSSATCDAGVGEHCKTSPAVSLEEVEDSEMQKAPDLKVELLQSRLQRQKGTKVNQTKVKRTQLKQAKKVKHTKMKKTDALEEKLEHLAEFEQEISSDPKLKEEAHTVAADLAQGGMKEVFHDPAAEQDIADMLFATSGQVSPENAAKDGFEITNDDLVELHHGVNMEAVNKNTFQGDMMPQNNAQKLLFAQIAAKHGAYAWAGTPWPGGVVKYCLAADLPDNAVKAVQLSVEQFKKAVACIQWVDVGYKSGTSTGNDGRCQEDGAIFVQAHPTDGCWSYVGKIGHVNQPLQIASPGCDSVGTTMHEFAHALGMAHEQSRPDRDTYVSVDLDNTKEDAQFEISQHGDTKRPYDILSLMHYGLGDFATDKTRPVITVKPKGYEKYTSDPAEYAKFNIGNRIGLSQTDVEQLADMYNSEVAGGCKAMTLQSATTCVDKLKQGKAFSDGYGNCDRYRDTSTPEDPCSKYTAGRYCCGCGGGWAVQTYGGAATSPPSPPSPAPPPSTPPPSSPPSPAPPPSTPPPSTSCVDSTTYKDPVFEDNCDGWEGYNCEGYDFTDKLEENCRKACGKC